MSTTIPMLDVCFSKKNLCLNLNDLEQFVRLMNLTSRVPLSSADARPYLIKYGFDVSRAMAAIKLEHALVEVTREVPVLVYTGEPDIKITKTSVSFAKSPSRRTKLIVTTNEIMILERPDPKYPWLQADRKRPRRA